MHKDESAIESNRITHETELNSIHSNPGKFAKSQDDDEYDEEEPKHEL